MSHPLNLHFTYSQYFSFGARMRLIFSRNFTFLLTYVFAFFALIIICHLHIHEFHLYNDNSITLNPRDTVVLGRSLYFASISLNEMDELVKEHSRNITATHQVSNPSCEKVILLIPYRNRKLDLLTFLLHMTPYLRLRGIPYEIVVAEQHGDGRFNRAKLFNAALREIFKANANDRISNSSCFAFHDADKIPVSMNTPYQCLFRPHQLLRYVQYKEGGKV